MKKKKLFLVSGLLIVILVTAIGYWVFKLRKTADAVFRVDYIVVAAVDKIESHWNNEKTKIYTFIELEIEDVVKGPKSIRTLTVRIPGGKVGEVGMHVDTFPPFPEFQQNEEAIVFIERAENGFLIPLEKHTIRTSGFIGVDTKADDYIESIHRILKSPQGRILQFLSQIGF